MPTPDYKKKIKFDELGKRFYETGVKNVILYRRNSSGAYVDGVAWNGVTAITESPSGAEASPLYADDIKYLNLISNEEFGASIEAYTYPEEFGECDGSAALMDGVKIYAQPRKTFGLCYRTVIGNDIDNNEYGFKLHLIYGCLAAVSEKAYATINDSPEAITFSWEISTTPVEVEDVDDGHKLGKPTAILTIDSTKFTDTTKKAKLNALIEILEGKDPTTSPEAEGVAPRLPLPGEVLDLLSGT